MVQDSEQEHVGYKPDTVLIMVPFDARFTHGLKPSDVFGGTEASAGPENTAPKSFSYEGFGFHPENSLLHVIDLSLCNLYKAHHDRNFGVFASIEMTADEDKLLPREGRIKLIQRCVRQVAISNPQTVQYEPDSLVHDVLVRIGNAGKVPEIPRGEVVYRSSMSPEARQELISTHKLRQIPLDSLDIPVSVSIRTMGRKKRLSRLRAGMDKNIVDSSLDKFYTNTSASSANIGPVRVIGDEEGVKITHMGFGNPGLEFSATDSLLRTGRQLRVETDLPDVAWGPMMAKLNPLAYWLPPNIVNYYDLFLIPPIPELEMLGKYYRIIQELT